MYRASRRLEFAADGRQRQNHIWTQELDWYRGRISRSEGPFLRAFGGEIQDETFMMGVRRSATTANHCGNRLDWAPFLSPLIGQSVRSTVFSVSD